MDENDARIIETWLRKYYVMNNLTTFLSHTSPEYIWENAFAYPQETEPPPFTREDLELFFQTHTKP